LKIEKENGTTKELVDIICAIIEDTEEEYNRKLKNNCYNYVVKGKDRSRLLI